MNLEYKIWDKCNKEWVKHNTSISQHGLLHHGNLISINMEDFEVCVYTGRKDSFGEKLFEHDSILVNSGFWDIKTDIFWNKEQALFGLNGGFDEFETLSGLFWHIEYRNPKTIIKKNGNSLEKK